MTRLFLLALLVLLIIALAWRDAFGFDIAFPEREDLRRWIDGAGLLGPLLVVALMTAAIVASPLPWRAMKSTGINSPRLRCGRIFAAFRIDKSAGKTVRLAISAMIMPPPAMIPNSAKPR